MVQSVRFVAGLGVAHLPYHLTAERVQHVKRLAAVLPEDTADAVLIHEPRLVRHDDVALWGQGRSYAAFHAAPKAAHAPLSSVFLSVLAQQPVCVAARDPPRAVAHDRVRRHCYNAPKNPQLLCRRVLP